MSEQEIYIEAINRRDPAECRRFLDEVCAGNEVLRGRIETLIRQSEQLGSFLENSPQPLGATADISVAVEKLGTQIGPYKLMEQIGEGGMGLVFVAEQHEPVRRKVALKLIKPGMDSREIIARFEAERQALALMDHPNIARVLDAGATASGRPYFVMELVKGVPITQFCDDNRLSSRERLELFTHVCHAVQHAHQKGIIHRDIKPTNVLVTSHDGRPVVKVIDFGVAKAVGQQLTEKTLYTNLAQMIGTPLYMSPEQVGMSGLDIDTRTDIYSLGVLLYELLTGTTPFDKERLKQAAYDEMRRIIREEEPQKPSTRISTTDAAPSIAAQRQTEPAKLTKLVRGDLDWIVMKALEKDRNRRYETASGFAVDVQHYLMDEPVLACPPSTLYRFRKFARRNQARLLIGGTFAVAALVIAGVVAASLGWAARNQQFRQAKLNHEVELAIKDAQHARERALALTDNPYQWEAALAAAGSAVKGAAGIAAQDEAALSLALQDRLRSLQQALEADERDRNFAARLDAIRLDQSELNMAYCSFRLDSAYPAIRQALDDFYEVRIGTTRLGEAERIVQGRPKAIQQFLLAAMELAQTHVPPTEAQAKDWLTRLLAAVDPAPWRQRALQAEQTGNWESLAQLVTELTAARQPPSDLLRLAERAPPESAERLAILRGIRQAYPADFWANHQLANCLHRCRDPRFDEAARYYAAAVALRPHSAAAAINLGDSLREKGDNEAALVVYRDTLRMYPDYDFAHFSIGLAQLALLRLDGASLEMREAIRLRPESGNGYWGLGEVLVKQQKFTEAEARYREGLAREPLHYWCRFGLANLMLKQERPAEAETQLRQLVQLDPKMAWGHIYLGRALQAQEKFPESEQAYLEAIRQHPGNGEAHTLLAELRQRQGTAAVAESKLRASAPQAASDYDIQLQRGMLLRHEKKFAEAEACLREAVGLRPELALAHYQLGLVLEALQQPAQAEIAIRESIRLAPTLGGAHSSLGWLLVRAKNPVGAEAAFRESLRLYPHPGTYFALGVALRDQQKISLAQEALREAVRLNPDEFYPHRELASILFGQQRWSEAEAEFREALRVTPEHANSHFGLGKTLFELQNYAEAEAAWRESLRLEPENEAIYVKLSKLLRGQKRYAEAEADLSEALRQHPDWARAHAERGWLLRDQEKYAEAESAFREAVRLMPDLAGAQAGLGYMLAALARPAEAIGPLREAVRLTPDDRHAYEGLGWALLNQRQFAKAEFAFRETVRLDPSYAKYHCGLGRALLEQVKLEAAEASLREAIRLEPAHRQARQLLARVLMGRRKLEEAEALRKELPTTVPCGPEN